MAIENFSAQFNQVIENIQEGDGIELIGKEKEEEIDATEELKDLDATVIRLVNLILKEAISRNAMSYIEPYEHELRIRFKTDGTLTTLAGVKLRGRQKKRGFLTGEVFFYMTHPLMGDPFFL